MDFIPKDTYHEQPEYRMQSNVQKESQNLHNYNVEDGEENAISSEDGFTEDSFDSI